MRRDCWMNPPRIQAELIDYFSRVSDDVSEFNAENTDTSEPFLEGYMVNAINSKLTLSMESRIATERELRNLSPVKLKFSAKSITPSESAHGADLGIVARISLPTEFEATKAVLVQSKRLYPSPDGSFNDSCEYRELFAGVSRNTTLLPQWERMQAVTQESVYLFFGPKRMKIDRSIKEYGMRVVKASLVEGMYKAGLTRFTAKEVFRYSAPFSEWMVEEFLCCNVGDKRPRVVETAMGLRSEFPMRNVLEADIYAADEPRLRQF